MSTDGIPRDEPEEADRAKSISNIDMNDLPQSWRDRWLNIVYGNSEGDNCDEFVDVVISYYESMLGFSGFLAGFEFLGVSGIEVDNDTTELAAFIMTLAYVFAMGAACILLIQLGWFRFYKGFPTTVVEAAIAKFYYLLDIGAHIVMISLALFFVSTMALVWDIFQDSQFYAIIIYVAFGMMIIVSLAMSWQFNGKSIKPWVSDRRPKDKYD